MLFSIWFVPQKSDTCLVTQTENIFFVCVILPFLFLSLLFLLLPYFNGQSQQANSAAYNISLPNQNGTILSLDKNVGKYVYLHFWASWCEPCLEEMEHSVVLRQEYLAKNADIEFVYMSSDKADGKWKANIAKHALGGDHYLMNDYLHGQSSREYIILELPRYMLLNKKGEIVEEFAPRPRSKELRAKIDVLLATE